MADERLKDLIDFIDSLQKEEVFNIDRNKIVNKGLAISGHYSFNSDFPGVISLYGKILDKYRVLVGKLNKELNKNKKVLDYKYIDDITKESMLLKYNKKDYVSYLTSKLLSAPNTFFVYLEVKNFALLNGKPLYFNRCKFFYTSKRKLKYILDNQGKNKEEIENHEELIGKLFCEIETKAIDLKTARENALKTLNNSLNLINFIGGVYKIWNPHVGRVFNPYYFSTVTSHKTFIRNEVRYVQCVMGWNQDGVFRMEQLKSQKHLYLLFLKIKRLSNYEDKNSFIKHLLIAIHWCGKSFFEERNAVAFNCCITSLETILLANSKVELTFKLSLFTSYLAPENPNLREIYFKKIKELYDIRSDITHNGLDDLFDEDVELLRRITFEILKAIINDKKYEFLKSKNIEEFNKKLINMVLK